jgi:Protein of unknown function (DUF2933)
MNEHTIANMRDWTKSHVTAIAVACVFLAGLGLNLLMQHTAHVVGALPYALILLCPLMHMLMPGGHGGRGGHGGHGGQGDHSGHMGQGGSESYVGQDDAAQPRQERD